MKRSRVTGMGCKVHATITAPSGAKAMQKARPQVSLGQH